MHFGENQLSRSLIGLSPLPTPHPPSLQPRWVRASTTSYSRFTLDMGRSPRFGSTTHHCTPYSDSLSLRLHHNGLTSRHTITRRLILQKARHHPPTQEQVPRRALTDYRHMVSGTLSLPSRGTFHHSLTVLIHYRSPDLFRLSRRSCQIHTSLHETRATREHHPNTINNLHLRDSHPLRSAIPHRSTSH
jgi:hypothetical protein